MRTWSWTKNKQLCLIWVCIKLFHLPLPSLPYLHLINHPPHAQAYIEKRLLHLTRQLTLLVIPAFSSTLSTLIMQLNAALRIPAAAYPHSNITVSYSLCHTHTNHGAFLSFYPKFSTIHSQTTFSPKHYCCKKT